MRGLTTRLRVVLGLLLVPLLTPVVLAQDTAQEERLLKAAFIYNFAKFTRWPAGTWADEQAHINLCLAGTDELIVELERLEGKTVKGRPLTITRWDEGGEAPSCHIVYVATSERERYQQVTETMRDKAVLMVSRIPDFAQSGGTIELFRKEGRVRFIINLDAARHSRLEISSRLLNLAEIVGQKVAP